jgi:tRNA nucleotidyltransferase/poly(A) polymerase
MMDSQELQQRVIAWLADQEVPAYLVGGCVRDRLLGRPTYDLDVAVADDGLSLARRLANALRGDYYALDVERATGRAILYPDEGRLMVDVARFRGEPPLNLEGDLAGRDFTVNALAVDVRAPGDIVDRHAGLADLEARVLRPVTEGSIRDDPLRALRAVRLAAGLGFRLAPETKALMARDGPALTRVSGERVRDELVRLLAGPDAAPWLACLDELGLLAAILPELEPLRGLEQSLPHRLDALAHTLGTVAALEGLVAQLRWQEAGPGDGGPMPWGKGPLPELQPFAARLLARLAGGRPRLVLLKMALLLHDTGKAATRSEDQGRIRFIDHERVGARLAGEALRRLRFNKPEVHLVQTIVRGHMRPPLLAEQESVSGRAVHRFFRDTEEAGIEVLLHALADHAAIYPPGLEDERWPRLVALVARMLAEYWERPAKAVTPPSLLSGHDLIRELGVVPGPEVGALLEAVREAQAGGEVHTREEALALVRRLRG